MSNTEQCEIQEVKDHTTVVRYTSSEVHNAPRNTLLKPTITSTVYTKNVREEIRHTKLLQHFMNQMTKECPQPECEATWAGGGQKASG